MLFPSSVKLFHDFSTFVRFIRDLFIWCQIHQWSFHLVSDSSVIFSTFVRFIRDLFIWCQIHQWSFHLLSDSSVIFSSGVRSLSWLSSVYVIFSSSVRLFSDYSSDKKISLNMIGHCTYLANILDFVTMFDSLGYNRRRINIEEKICLSICLSVCLSVFFFFHFHHFSILKDSLKTSLRCYPANPKPNSSLLKDVIKPYHLTNEKKRIPPKLSLFFRTILLLQREDHRQIWNIFTVLPPSPLPPPQPPSHPSPEGKIL